MSATPRQPLLWAALAYGAGIVVAPHIWRPATWWIVTITAFLAAAAILLRRRPRVAQILVMTALASIAILTTQLRLVASPPAEVFSSPEGTENEFTAHVTAEGESLSTPRGGLRQTISVETEGAAPAGLRLNIFTTERLANTVGPETSASGG